MIFPARLPVQSLSAQLMAGRPVLLLPSFAPLQPPDLAHCMVIVSRVHPQALPGTLRLDLDGDCGLLLVEAWRGGRRNG